jgi:hypothetical protein
MQQNKPIIESRKPSELQVPDFLKGAMDERK